MAAPKPIEFRGEMLTLGEIARRVGIHAKTLHYRVATKRMDIESAVAATTPSQRAVAAVTATPAPATVQVDSGDDDLPPPRRVEQPVVIERPLIETPLQAREAIDDAAALIATVQEHLRAPHALEQHRGRMLQWCADWRRRFVGRS